MINMMNKSIIDLPTPNNISYLWNWGSMLGVILMIQIITGLILSMHYTANTELAFNSISYISRNINQGNNMRFIHMNCASMFFIMIYMHIFKGLKMNSYKIKETWLSGSSILIILMITAFVGYVLPWGQMSFWGTTVITNLLSVVPFIGKKMVMWLWGNFSVSNPTLNRFFSFHFILPFIMLFLMLIHLFTLHKSGSSNPSATNLNNDKISFHPMFSLKDMNSIMLMLILVLIIILITPNMLGDPENFNQADPLKSPPHIQPEWYFLFAYAILRSIPNKMGGVLALLCSVSILYIMPLTMNNKKNKKISLMKNLSLLLLLSSFLILTWIGANPVENPFIKTGQINSMLYFISFILMS
uniref:Cytochrome b n=1 Tax=Spinibdella lignicola TaxID=2872682 RepID=A0A977X2R5_9ACAR|nr:cytochrome b [Spinibdella lignicola]UXN44124.1 cytochrome b [Spinibdella lignicola]